MRPYLIILTIILAAGCDFIKTDKRRLDKAEEYKEFFYENRDTFEQLIKDIQVDKDMTDKMGLFQKVEKLQDKEKVNTLTSLDIHMLTISETNCDELEMEFITSWTDYPIGQMYLTKDCSDEKSGKGNYWKDGFIEVWGLGEGWMIWIDSDPI